MLASKEAAARIRVHLAPSSDEVASRLLRLRLPDTMKPALNRLGSRLAPELRDATPKGKTGKARESIRYRLEDSAQGPVLAFYGSKIVGYLISGTRAHVIRAKNADALAFEWPKGEAAGLKAGPDGLFFFQQVHHPGTKPVDIVGRALRSGERDVQQELHELGLRIIYQLKPRGGGAG